MGAYLSNFGPFHFFRLTFSFYFYCRFLFELRDRLFSFFDHCDPDLPPGNRSAIMLCLRLITKGGGSWQRSVFNQKRSSPNSEKPTTMSLLSGFGDERFEGFPSDNSNEEDCDSMTVHVFPNGQSIGTTSGSTILSSIEHMIATGLIIPPATWGTNEPPATSGEIIGIISGNGIFSSWLFV